VLASSAVFRGSAGRKTPLVPRFFEN